MSRDLLFRSSSIFPMDLYLSLIEPPIAHPHLRTPSSPGTVFNISDFAEQFGVAQGDSEHCVQENTLFGLLDAAPQNFD
jgi:hypothetical protein